MQLYDFLHQRRKRSPDESPNFVAFSDEPSERGAYVIVGSDKTTFYKLYVEALASQKELYLLEKPGPHAPVLVDIDLRPGSGQRMYTQEHIHTLVSTYFEFFREYIEIPDTARCFVMERAQPYQADGGKWKDGVHMLITLNVEVPLRRLARTHVIEKCKDLLMNISPGSKSADDIVDAAVISKNFWYVYGSTKKGVAPYLITRVFRPDMTEDDAWSQMPMIDLVQHLSVMGPGEPNAAWLPDKEQIVHNRFNEALWYTQQGPAPREGRAATVVRPLPAANRSHNVDPEKFELVRRLVMECLSDERADKYEPWRDVGYVLHWISRTYGDPEETMLDLWDNFSKRSPKFRPGVCDGKWGRMDNSGGLTINSLFYWARMDNPEVYHRIMSEDLRHTIEASVRIGKGSETHVAKVLYRMYRTTYATTRALGARMTKWYEYKPHEHRWVEIPDGNSLRAKIEGQLTLEYTKTVQVYRMQACDPNVDQVQKDTADAMCKALCSVVDKLGRTAFKENIMKEVGHMFYDADFETRINTDPYLVGFTNGVLNLRTMEFRDGRPEDYITVAAGVRYVEYDDNNEAVQHLLRIIAQIITDDATRVFVLKHLASCLLGQNREQKFYIWQGVGCHAYGTRLIMSDGSIREVQDIQVGDQLMGDDGQARTVLDLKRGRDVMVRVVPGKGNPFVVNQHHILTLVAGSLIRQQRDGQLIWLDRESLQIRTLPARDDIEYPPEAVASGEVIDVSVVTYQAIASMLGHNALFLFRVPTVFPPKAVRLPPYAVGAWMAQSKSVYRNPHRVCLTSETAARMQMVLAEAGYNLTMSRHSRDVWHILPGGDEVPSWEDAVRSEGMDPATRTVSLAYIANDAASQREFLAGIVDARGKYEEWCKHIVLPMSSLESMRTVAFVAHSLGFGCRTYVGKFPKHTPRPGFMVYLHGQGLDTLPLASVELCGQCATHQSHGKQNPLRTGFRIERMSTDDYYGFELDGNGRYLLEEHLVTHNSNGKSILVNFMKSTLNQYATQANVTLLTRSRAASGAANPDLVDLVGRRFVVLQEPEENEKLNTGFMKELTGGDTISVRGLYQGQTQLKPQFKIIYCCNHLPNIVTSDFGTWRRIVVIPFLSQFLDPSRFDPDNPRHFRIDPDLAEIIERTEYKEAFMSILVRYYRIYMETGLIPSELILGATQQFQEKSDIISEYLSERVERTENLKDVLTVKPLNTDFRFWYGDNYGKERIPNRNELKERVEKVIGPCNNGWKGYRLKQAQDNAPGDDADD